MSSGYPDAAPARLRPTQEADLPFVLALELDEANRQWIIPWSRERHVAAICDPDQAHLIIGSLADPRPQGYMILSGLRDPNCCVELRRILVAPKGHGLGRQAVRLVKDRAFTEWNAHRLWLDVKEHNVAARRLYESEGFKAEGVLRECLNVGERFESLLVMSMLRSEYRGP